ncbi:response regulator transcription factor [Marinobacterium jannaschii]|uniref:response regulator transcription factor n=1 Tax=Marinobacterium jannaschii TaxID=64970 RepID=UPI0004812C18|nr:winged helix-turn-helix domain-containing protein [Marinobacterium jannaschii]
MRIVWVESDTVFRNLQSENLRSLGYVIDQATDLARAVKLARSGGRGLIIYDRSFGQGIDWLSLSFLAEVNIPLLIIVDQESSAKREDIIGFKICRIIHRPVSKERLLDEVRNCLTDGRCELEGSRYRLNGVLLDEARSELVDEKGDVICLTRSEMTLMRSLLMYPDKVFSKHELNVLLGTRPNGFKGNCVEVHIGNLRKKVGAYRIRTLWGRGYMLAATPFERTDRS